MHFQENLARAIDNPEEMEYLSQIDFAADCYAYASALQVYPYDRALQAWCMNGYMLAWQQHFFIGESEVLSPIAGYAFWPSSSLTKLINPEEFCKEK